MVVCNYLLCLEIWIFVYIFFFDNAVIFCTFKGTYKVAREYARREADQTETVVSESDVEVTKKKRSRKTPARFMDDDDDEEEEDERESEVHDPSVKRRGKKRSGVVEVGDPTAEPDPALRKRIQMLLNNPSSRKGSHSVKGNPVKLPSSHLSSPGKCSVSSTVFNVQSFIIFCII